MSYFGVHFVICIYLAAVAQPESDSKINPSTHDSGLPKMAYWQTGPVCGLNVLYCLLRTYDKPVRYQDLLHQLSPPEKGSSLEEMRLAAQDYGLKLHVYSTSQKTVDIFDIPFIAHLDYEEMQHYVLVTGRVSNDIKLFDPLTNTTATMPAPTFFRMWSGNALATGTRQADRLYLLIILFEALCLGVLLYDWLKQHTKFDSIFNRARCQSRHGAGG